MAKQAQIDAVRPILTEIDKNVSTAEHAIDAVVSGADKATDILESGLDKAADVVPDVLDKSVHVAADVTREGVRAFRNPKVVLLAIGLSGAAAGVALGMVAYRMQKRRIEKQYEEKLEKELAEMRKFYIRRNKEGAYSTPRTTAEELLINETEEAMDRYQGKNVSPLKVVGDENPAQNQQTRYDKVVTNEEAQAEMRDHAVKVEETVDRNIFVDGRPLVDDEWDQAEEETRRNEAIPYVISHREFMENTFEHEQTSLTYYQGDDVLADEKDEMIPDIERFVGTDNLRFGHGSMDPNIVYIRNERTEADYEVALSTGKYSEEVMGIQHSDDIPRGLRRARWGDDE